MKRALPFFVIALVLAASAIAQENEYVEITLNYERAGNEEAITLSGIKLKNGIMPEPLITPNMLSIMAADSGGNRLWSSSFGIPSRAKLPSEPSQQMAEQSEKIRIAAPVFDDAELMISDSNGNIKLRIPAQTLPEIKKQSIPRALIAVALAAVVLVSLLLVMRSKKSLYGKTRYSPKLRSYIISNLKKGYTKQQIRNALLKNKYTSKEIEDAFRGIR